MPTATLNVPPNGTAIDVSTFGRLKRFYVSDEFQGSLIIQAALDGDGSDASGAWLDIARLSGGEGVTVDLYCKYLKVSTSRLLIDPETPPNVSVSADTAAPTFTYLEAPNGSGEGSTTDTTALGADKTIVVVGSFEGQLFIDAIVAGAVERVGYFNGEGGALNISGIYSGMKVTRTRASSGNVPSVYVAANSPGGAPAATPTQVITLRADAVAMGSSYLTLDEFLTPVPSCIVKKVRWYFESGSTDPAAENLLMRLREVGNDGSALKTMGQLNLGSQAGANDGIGSMGSAADWTCTAAADETTLLQFQFRSPGFGGATSLGKFILFLEIEPKT